MAGVGPRQCNRQLRRGLLRRLHAHNHLVVLPFLRAKR